MAKRKVREAVAFFERCLGEEGVKASKIVLFGSQAKGTSTAESDLDILVVSEDFRGKDIFERAAMTKRAEIRTLKKFMIPIDIFTLTPEEAKKSLIASYAERGEVVHGVR